eukprot:10316895-Alexandrium_andersonii.AAC.1
MVHQYVEPDVIGIDAVLFGSETADQRSAAWSLGALWRAWSVPRRRRPQRQATCSPEVVARPGARVLPARWCDCGSAASA